MTTILQAIILGIIQGITEWLPVSSSGHLVIAQEFLNLQAPVLFDVMLHIGTLLVALFVFWKEVKGLILCLFVKEYHEYRKLLFYVFIGSAATAVVGLIFQDLFMSFFNNLFAVGVALLFTALLLFASRKHTERKELNWKDSLLIGLIQGVSIIPGVSRSGSTISLGLLRGLRREEAARFSFILMMPAILGALFLLLLEGGLGNVEVIPAFVGTLVAMVVGYISLKGLLMLIQNEKFHYFSWYCAILGIILILS